MPACHNIKELLGDHGIKYEKQGAELDKLTGQIDAMEISNQNLNEKMLPDIKGKRDKQDEEFRRVVYLKWRHCVIK